MVRRACRRRQRADVVMVRKLDDAGEHADPLDPRAVATMTSSSQSRGGGIILACLRA
jgi:hypothetical protein